MNNRPRNEGRRIIQADEVAAWRAVELWSPGGFIWFSLLSPEDDCHRFAGMVDKIAASHDTTEGFMDEMARTFTAANNSSKDELSANGEHALPPDRIQIGDGGFKPGLRRNQSTGTALRWWTVIWLPIWVRSANDWRCDC
jgi:hypothetical protein